MVLVCNTQRSYKEEIYVKDKHSTLVFAQNPCFGRPTFCQNEKRNQVFFQGIHHMFWNQQQYSDLCISVTAFLKWPSIALACHEDSSSVFPRSWSSLGCEWLWVSPHLWQSKAFDFEVERLCKPLATASCASHLFLLGTYLLGYMYCVIEADFSVAVKPWQLPSSSSSQNATWHGGGNGSFQTSEVQASLSIMTVTIFHNDHY